MSKQQTSGLELRAVGGEKFINIGTGNITYVETGSDWDGTAGSRVGFVGGDSTFVPQPLEAVVDRLRHTPGFGR